MKTIDIVWEWEVRFPIGLSDVSRAADGCYIIGGDSYSDTADLIKL
jgi:hypothetical protein